MVIKLLLFFSEFKNLFLNCKKFTKMKIKRDLFSQIIDIMTLPQNENNERKKLIMEKYLESNDVFHLKDDTYRQLIKDVNPDIYEDENGMKNYIDCIHQRAKNLKKIDQILRSFYEKRNSRNVMRIFENEGEIERFKANDLFHGYRVTLDNEAYFDMYSRPSVDFFKELLCRSFGVNSVVWKFKNEPIMPVKLHSSVTLKFHLPKETDIHRIKIEVDQWQ